MSRRKVNRHRSIFTGMLAAALVAASILADVSPVYAASENEDGIYVEADSQEVSDVQAETADVQEVSDARTETVAEDVQTDTETVTEDVQTDTEIQDVQAETSDIQAETSADAENPVSDTEGSDLDLMVDTANLLAGPSVVNIDTTYSSDEAAYGVSVKWSALSLEKFTSEANFNASDYYYQVYRADAAEFDGTWTNANKWDYTTGCSIFDGSVLNDETYIYAVALFKGDVQLSEFSVCKPYTYMDPVLAANVNVTITSGGIRLTWKKIAGANGYYIYRKTGTGAYSYIGRTTSETAVTYTDAASKLKSGTDYTYAIRAYHNTTTDYGNTTSIGFFSAKKIRFIGSVTPSLINYSGGILVKWSKMTGANGYYVYRKTLTGSFVRIGEVTSGSTVSYKDTAVSSKNGTAYIYCVRAYFRNSKGSEIVGWFTQKATFRIATTSITSLQNAASGKMTVNYKAVSKATGYQIQYATNSSFSNAKLSAFKGASVVSKVIGSLTKGKTYYVRVRAFRTTSAGAVFYGGWSGVHTVKITK